MKRKSLITLILASMAIGALVGCTGNKGNQNNSSNNDSGSNQPSSETTSSDSGSTSQDEMPAEYSLMKYWAGNPAEDYYDVDDTGDTTIITYTDLTGEENGGWAYVNRAFAYDAAKLARFTEYKKFSFTAKLEKTTGSDIVLVKAEGAQNFEKRIQIGTEPQTFEFSTAFISDWSQMSSLLFFANRSIKESGNGVLTLTRFVLSKEEVNPDYDISGSMPTVPQDWNYYDGETKLNVMYSWGYNAQGEIATEAVAGGFKFTWGGSAEKSEAWSYVSAKIKNANDNKPMKDSGFKRIVYEFTGTNGQEAMFKFEAHQGKNNLKAVEQKVELNGSKQTIEIDIKAEIGAADADQYWALIMPAPGKTGTLPAGELTLTGCYLDQTAIVVPEETNDPLFPVIWMDKVATHDECYTVSKGNHMINVDYNKAALGWESLLLKVSETEEWYATGDNAKGYNRVVGTLKATSHVKVLLKPYDANANEHWYELEAGVAQEVDFLVNADTVDLTKSFVVFIAVGDGEQDLTGRVTLDGFRLSRENVNIGYDAEVRLNKVNNAAAGIVTELDANNDLVANFSFDAKDYHSMELFMSARDNALYNKLTGKITSTVKTSVLFKPANDSANELAVPLEAGVEYDLDLLFTKSIDYNWSQVYIFIAFNDGDALEGKITFKDFQLEIYDPEYVSKEANTINMAGAYIDNWAVNDECYSLKRISNGTRVEFGNKAAGWESMQAKFALAEGWFNIADYTRFTGTLTSSVNIKVMVKPYDANANEHAYDLVANEPQRIDFTVDAATADIEKSFVMFIGIDGCEPGELLIEDLAMSNPKANVAKDGKLYLDRPFVANDTKYTVESHDDGKGMTLGYVKVVDMDWEAIQLFCLAHDFTQHKTLHLEGHVDGNVHIMFKLDVSNEEQSVALETGDFDTEITFTNSIDAKWNKVLVFVAYDGADADSATINFSQLYFG